MYMDICENSGALSTILLIKNVIDIIKIGVPIILIIMCAVDLLKQVINTEEKSYKRIIKRMIAAASVFFVPTIVSLLLDVIGTQDYTATTCWTNANTETITVLSAREKQEKIAQEEAIKKEQEEARKAREEIAKAQEEIRKKREEEAKKEEENNNNNNNDNDDGGNNEGDGDSGGTEIIDDTMFKENGKDGKVEVVNGVFYKPSSGKSGAEGTKGSGAYGYNIFFLNRMKAFVEGAKAAGHKISYSTSEYGAWRPISLQNYYWNCYQTKSCNNGNLAAVPGTSNHGWGIASDLSFGTKSALYWAHDNCAKYGLKFPLCNNVRGSCQENWHLEPAQLKKK